MGSLALSLCHLAAGRLDAVCSLKPYRSVDVAAGAAARARARARVALTSTGRALRRRAARPRRRVRASPLREPTTCVGRCISARCPHRLLGLELRALAERRLLSAAPARVDVARALRAVLRHRRGQRDVLSTPAARRRSRAGSSETPPGFVFAVKACALPHAHQAAERPRARASTRFYDVHRAAASARRSSARSSGSCRRTSSATTSGSRARSSACRRGSATRSSSATRAGSTRTSTRCCASTASRS